MEQLKKRIAELEKENRKLQRQNAALTVRAAILPAAWAAGVRAEAMDDLLNRAESKLTFGDSRQITDESGRTPEQWLAELKTVAPHLWQPAGTGNHEPEKGLPERGLPREFQGANNPWSRAGWNLTRQGRVLIEHGDVVAERLAKLAGTNIGATSPADK